MEAEARGLKEKLEAIGSHSIPVGLTVLNRTVVVGMTKNQQGLGIGLGDKGKEKSSSTPKFGK